MNSASAYRWTRQLEHLSDASLTSGREKSPRKITSQVELLATNQRPERRQRLLGAAPAAALLPFLPRQRTGRCHILLTESPHRDPVAPIRRSWKRRKTICCYETENAGTIVIFVCESRSKVPLEFGTARRDRGRRGPTFAAFFSSNSNPLHPTEEWRCTGALSASGGTPA